MSDIVETTANGAENATVTPAKSIIITKSIKSLTTTSTTVTAKSPTALVEK